MLDWKIVGASFAALVVVSSVFVGSSFGLGDFFSDIMEQIGGWMEGSPFGGFFSTTPTKGAYVSLTLSPDRVEFSPAYEVNITAGKTRISGFKGRISADFTDDTVLLEQEKTGLTLNLPITYIDIDNLAFNSLVVEGTSFLIKPNMTAENGTVEISGFSGKGRLSPAGLELEGNMSKLRTMIGNLTWDLS